MQSSNLESPKNISGRIMEVDLVIFGLLEFDVILGIEWLSKHFSKIDYWKREIVFDFPNDCEKHYVEKTIRTIPSIVSTIQANR